MNKIDDVYSFENNDFEKASEDFNLNDISGLGQDDYENPDLFETSVDDEVKETAVNEVEEQPFYIEQPITTLVDDDDDIDLTPFSDLNFDPETGEKLEADKEKEEFPSVPELSPLEPVLNAEDNDIVEDYEEEEIPFGFDINKEDNELENINEEISSEKQEEEDIKESEEIKANEDTKGEEYSYSDTPIEELSKLTEYEEPEIEVTDINGLFDKVNVNVKEASDIFKKNTEMKDKIDSRFNELKKLQSEIEKSKDENIREVDRYKEEVVQKLTDKKQEIEERLNTLKNLQVDLEQEKQNFENYKKEETEKMESTKKNIEDAYEERKKELSHIEDILRRQKDSLDEQRNELQLDRIKYEADKNELANNLLKFNELVNSFTNGVNEVEEGE